MEFSTENQDLIEIKKLAQKVLGSQDIADEWLNSFNLRIGDTPLSILNKENGAGEVKRILAAIAYGGAA